ncbi:ATP-dependent RNA helicase HrpA [Actinomyces bovis]|uniref:ATP-dependent RNA helicase HrpA n=1 Tax=Actinomyces bovis TaxID=1658 RepID=A0ABY1VPI2_9ACTO|nr:ATP-dependent RNA helicase HrpA [Actinomyces bovis]SPT53632.1 ATP-dependent RNA helicase HrpA [Actinomyces bovis]VEG55694.1 ATP-dependent RNA helicase HrpA [Actinomyces israelii]
MDRPHRRHRTWPGYTPEQLAARAAVVPTISYPTELPVSARREEIAAAIRDHQVVIVAGETGSGKTTQLPKICLELGRGISGMIGHTQPRRIAARSVAERIAQELATPIGRDGVVGYQVRFTEEVGANTLVKLMTDGILLAEIQSDPELRRYDTIIVDEAHERSLNIDFILGYLARLLPKRPDLKVIITSATIDSARFAEHFGHDAVDDRGQSARVPAPVIEVSGRTYPVEIRYRPLAPEAEAEPNATSREEERDQITGILDAVDELMDTGPGDILVFLAGERDIRDTESALMDHLGPRYTPDGRSRTPAAVEVVPLFSRLSAAEQHRVFAAHSCRRIVLATNVAETSLTVPGIRYVVDPGLARISRYSNRTKVQRLPIEPISQASASQRSGRCGRVADGVAIRLYSETDFVARPEYTEPEILRTSLASVILQMAALGLGAVEDFPFIDPPEARSIRDGLQLLTEIGAIEVPGARRSPASSRASRRGPRLTQIGRRLARLPIDPRLGRMLLEAGELGCAGEVMVIVSALSIQDVRERPTDRQEASDALHRRFADTSSDFLTYLNLWRYLRTQQRELSGSAFRRMCRAEFLHYLRVREWQDVHAQLRQLARPLGLNAAPVELPTARAIRTAGAALEPGTQAAQIANGDVAAAVVALGRSADTPDADAIHRSLLVGLLSNVGNWDERRREYAGARGTRFTIWPGSGLRRKTYDWVMTAELVETSRLFARTVAKVDSRWVEAAAERAGLLKRVHGEPYWSTRHGAAMVHEKALLYGMTLVADRAVPLASVGSASAREVAREMFIRSALVEGDWHSRHGFVQRNRELVEELGDVERRRREHGLLADDSALFAFYDDRLPESVYGANDFDAWWKREKGRHPQLLDYTRELLLPGGDDAAGHPDTWVQGDLTLGLEYVFEPGQANDGLSVLVPVEVLGRLQPAGFDWLVPGLRAELVVATIRALPKRVRRQLVPAPDVGEQLWAVLREEYGAGGGSPAAGGSDDGGAGTAASELGTGQTSAPELSFREAFSAVVSRLRDVEVSAADWAEAQERLPEHLRMSFVALDAAGREIGRSKDLVDLQKRLAGRSEQAVRSAVRGALAQALAEAQQREDRKRGRGKGKGRERTGAAVGDGSTATPSGGGAGGAAGGVARARAGGKAIAGPAGAQLPSKVGLAEKAGLCDWPVGVVGLEGPERSTIPQAVESTGRAGLVVRGYPALVATGPLSADLRILGDGAAQARAHGAGVLALALARTVLPTARVTSRWTAKETLTLAASPYQSTEELVTELQLAAARVVAKRWAQSAGLGESGLGKSGLAGLRERAVFEQLVTVMRQELEDEVYRVAQQVAAALTNLRELERVVTASTSLALLGTLQQVREHAATLVFAGFVAATPAEQLAHLPRFLRALALRVEKAQASPHQDAALAYQVRQAEEVVAAARARVAALPADAEREAVLEEARWMLEELRVSLFAQTLGTSRKVSPQRINKLVASL